MCSLSKIDFAEMELRVLGGMGNKYVELFIRVSEIDPRTFNDEMRFVLKEVTRSYIHGMPQEHTDKLVKKVHKILDKNKRSLRCLN